MASDSDTKKPKTASPKKVSKPTAAKTSKATKETPAKASFSERLKKIGVKREPNKKLIVIIGVGALSALIVTLITFGVLIYKYKSQSKAVAIAATIVPYPAVSVNGSVLWNVATYRQYLFELESIKKYLQYQGTDLKSDDGKKQLESMQKEVLTRLENNIIYAQGARKYGITVSQKEVDEQYNNIVTQAGGPDKVKSTLDKLYGWTVADFKEKIRDGIVQQKLGEKIAKDDKLNATANKQATDALKQIEEGGDFAEIAKKVSTDGYASNGGDLGFVSRGQLGVPELEDAAFKLEAGKVSGIIKTQYGYHIIKVTEKKDDQIRISQILIKSTDIDSWLKDQRSKAKISAYIK